MFSIAIILRETVPNITHLLGKLDVAREEILAKAQDGKPSGML
jgi:hypothetical protein